MRIHWTRARFRRRYLVILVFLMILPAVLIVISSSLAQTSSRRAQSVAPSPSPYCRSGDPLAGVYNPLRFRVLSKCQVASGVLASATLQDGRDERIYVHVDAQYAYLLGVGSSNFESGMLVLELVAQDQATIPVPSIGQHITLVGPWVYDTENQWYAICPVWSITTS